MTIFSPGQIMGVMWLKAALRLFARRIMGISFSHLTHSREYQ